MKKKKMKVKRNDKEVDGEAIGTLKSTVTDLYDVSLKLKKDMGICKDCPYLHVKHVIYGYRRHVEEPFPEPQKGTFILRQPSFFDRNPTVEEMERPENRTFFGEEYDEYECWAGCGHGKRDCFERMEISKKCIRYSEQLLNHFNKAKKRK